MLAAIAWFTMPAIFGVAAGPPAGCLAPPLPPAPLALPPAAEPRGVNTEKFGTDTERPAAGWANPGGAPPPKCARGVGTAAIMAATGSYAAQKGRRVEGRHSKREGGAGLAGMRAAAAIEAAELVDARRSTHVCPRPPSRASGPGPWKSAERRVPLPPGHLLRPGRSARIARRRVQGPAREEVSGLQGEAAARATNMPTKLRDLPICFFPYRSTLPS